MIHFFFENTPEIPIPDSIKQWIEALIKEEGFRPGEITYVFCDDRYLLKINQEYLQHDYYTDIITFDYVKGKIISGDIFVSLQRISDNSELLQKDYNEEMRRVIAHGILHLCGYNDKSETEQIEMRMKEDYYLLKY